MLGGRDCRADCAAFRRGQMRRRARILERVCLTCSLLAAQGPGWPCLLFLCSLSVCFPLHWSDHLSVPPPLKSCHNFGGGGGRRGWRERRGWQTPPPGRPTHNAARQAAEITKRLGLLRADALNLLFLQPSSGD